MGKKANRCPPRTCDEAHITFLVYLAGKTELSEHRACAASVLALASWPKKGVRHPHQLDLLCPLFASTLLVDVQCQFPRERHARPLRHFLAPKGTSCRPRHCEVDSAALRDD